MSNLPDETIESTEYPEEQLPGVPERDKPRALRGFSPSEPQDVPGAESPAPGNVAPAQQQPRALQGFDPLESNLGGGDVPGVEGPVRRGPEIQILSNIYEEYQEQGDIAGFNQRLNSALFLSGIYNEPVSTTLENLDYYWEQYFGPDKPPESNWQILKNEWDRARYSIAVAELGYQAMWASQDEWPDLIAQIEELQSQMPAMDETGRGLPMAVGKAVANMLPMMLSTMSESWQESLAGAGAGALAALVAGNASPLAVLPEELLTVPALAIRGATIGMRMGLTIESAKLEGGLIMADILTTVLENTGTEYAPEFEGAAMARALSAGPGLVIGLIEQVQFGNVFQGSRIAKKAFERALARFSRNGSVSGVFNNLAARSVRSYAGNITEETLQEMAQESISMAATEFSKYFMNEMHDAGIDQAQAQDWLDMLLETGEQSALAFSVIGLPGAAGQVRSQGRQMRELEGRFRRAQESLSQEGFNRLTEVVTQMEAENPGDGEAIFEQILGFVEEQDKATAEEATAEARAETVKTSTERIQRNLNRLRAAEQNVTNPEDLAIIRDEIAENERLLEEAQLESEAYVGSEGPREAWQMTPEEFEASRVQVQPTTLQFDSPVRQRIHEAMPQLTEKEVDALGLLLEVRAKAAGQTLDDYVNQTFAEGMFSTPETAAATIGSNKAAVTFMEDGRALIHVTHQSDFSSFVHELAHVLRRQLTPEMQDLAAAWAGAKDGWTRQAEEKFAKTLEAYMLSGEAPTPELRTLFQQIAEFMRRIYDAIKVRWSLKPEVRQTMDSLFTEPGSPVQAGAEETLYQERPKTQFEQKAAEYRDNPSSRPPQNKHGLAPYMREDTGLSPTEEFKLAKAPKRHLVKKNLQVVDEILAKHSDATDSIENWQQMMVDAVGDGEIPLSPRNIIKMLSDVNEWAGWFSRLSDKQLEMAAEGAVTGQELRKAYEDGSATVEVTGRLILWGILSRGVSPFVQEGGFIDALMGADKFIRLAAEGKFDDVALKDYQEWAKDLMGAGSGVPGAGTSHNLNAFGETTLRKMGTPGEDGITPLQKLHDMIADSSIPSKDIRRALYQMVESPGFDLKILSFILLVTGKTDVIILDRVQLRTMWNDGSLGAYNLYDGITEKVAAPTAKDPDNTKDVYVKGSRFSDVLSGMRGILIYEALERGVQEKIGELYEKVGRPEDASVGRYHWESWVLASNQEVGHGTIEMILAEMRGEDNPRAGYYVREGKYNTWNYGAMYLHDVFDQGWYVYEKSTGEKYAFTVPEWKSFISRVKLKSSGVVGEGFPNISEHTEKPWRQHEAVNNKNLDQLIEEHGTGVEELRRQRAAQTGFTEGASGSAGGRILFQSGDGTTAHERAVRQAVAEYKPVADNILEQYRGRPWADAELARRAEERRTKEATEQMLAIAREHDSPESFQEAVEDAAGASPETDSEWYESFWRRAVLEDATREEANKLWLQSMKTREDAQRFLDLMMANRQEMLGDPSIQAILWAVAQRRGEGVSPQVWDSILTMMRKNPEKYRRLEARMLNDEQALRKLAREDEVAEVERRYQEEQQRLDKVEPIDDRFRIAREIEDREQRARLLAGEMTGEELAAEVTRLDDELRVAQAENERLMEEMPEGVRDWARKDKVYQTLKRKLDAAQARLGKQEELTDKVKQLQAETERAFKDALRAAGQEAGMIADDQRQAYRDALKSAQQEARLNLEQLDQVYRDVIKSAQQESRLLYDRAVKAERQKYRERQAARRMRKYMQDLGKKIAKPVPKSVHYQYRQMIESIQAGIDPNFRSAKTLSIWERRKQFFNDNPEAFEKLPESMRGKLFRRSLNDFTVSELEEMANYVATLKKLGKLKRDLRKAQWDRESDEEIAEVRQAILKGEEAIESEEIKLNDTSRNIKEVALGFIRPERLADKLDGKQGFSGPVWQAFIKRYRDIRSAELRNQFAREKRIEGRMRDLEITERHLGSSREIDGVKYTVDQAIDVYAKSKNPRALLTLIHGNNMKPEHIAAVIESLSENEKKFGDAIIAEYEQHYERLRQAHLELTNEDMGHEPNYTPLIIREEGYPKHTDQIAEELMLRHGLRKATVGKGFTISRQNIPAEFRKQTKLGIYSVWREQIAKQEHYIESADGIRRMNRILQDRGVRDAIKQNYGVEYLKEMNKFVERVANPNIYRSYTATNRLARTLRRNSALAYLSFNLVTAAKQVPSVAFYLPYTGHHLFAAMGHVPTHWAETRQWMFEVAPQMKDRAIMRSLEELRPRENEVGKNFAKYQERLANAGMTPIRIMDSLAVTIGFKAAYDAGIAKNMSEDEAVHYALGVTHRTQPVAEAGEVGSNFAEDSMWGFFLQFSNQLNQVLNMALIDAPGAIKNHQFGLAMGTYFSIALSGMVMWALATRSIPDEPDDFAEGLGEQMLNMLPIIGPVIVSTMKGFDQEVSALAPAVAVGRIVETGRRIVTGHNISKGYAGFVTKEVFEGLAIALGVPYIGPERIATGTKRAMDEESILPLLQEVFFGGETDPDEVD